MKYFVEVNCIFHGHNESRSALVFNGTVASITSSFFISNEVGIPSQDFGDVSWVGGAIFSSNSVVWISRCLFTRNKAEYGGAIFAERKSIISVKQSNFVNNTSHNILSQFEFSDVNIELTNFTNNTINEDYPGGLLWTIESRVRVRHCVFRFTSGLIINSYESNITDVGSIYMNNTIKVSYNVVSGSIILRDCLFANNKVSYFIVNSVNSSLVISNCNWTQNSFPYTDTLIFSIGDTITLEGCNFKGTSKGSVLITDQSVVEITDSSFVNNSAEYQLFDFFQTKIKISTTTIAANYAEKRGIIFAIESIIEAEEGLVFTGSGNRCPKSTIFIIRSVVSFNNGVAFSNNMQWNGISSYKSCQVYGTNTL